MKALVIAAFVLLMAARGVRAGRRRYPHLARAGAAEDRRRPGRRGLEGRAAADDAGSMEVVPTRSAATRCPRTSAPRSASPTTIATSISRFTASTTSPPRSAPTSAAATASFSDDWIAMSLDSAGTGQSAYHLFSNPSGSQMDAINTLGIRRAVRRGRRVVQRREDDERRLRRRDPGAAADAALQGRRQGPHGPGVLPQGEPHRRVVRVAGDVARPVGVRSAVAHRVQTTSSRAGSSRCCRA